MHTPLQGPLSDVDALLLDIYSQIDEPDGMYAAARSQQAASQLALFEHEGAWDKALVSCDLMLPRGLAIHCLMHQFGMLLPTLACMLSMLSKAETQQQEGVAVLRAAVTWRAGGVPSLFRMTSELPAVHCRAWRVQWSRAAQAGKCATAAGVPACAPDVLGRRYSIEIIW